MIKPQDFFGAAPPNNVMATRKNVIINGNFDIWQRDTSQTTDGYGSADRWRNQYTGAAVRTISRITFSMGQSEVPGNPSFHLRTSISVSGGGSGDHVSSRHRVEDVRTLSGETATLTFYAKATAPNMYLQFAQNFGTGGSPSGSVYFVPRGGGLITDVGGSWKKYTLVIDVPSVAGKTLGTDNNHFLEIGFQYSAGASYSSGLVGFQTGTFDIAQVQLEKGVVATEFERRTEGEELALCQRYFQKSGNLYGHVRFSTNCVFYYNPPVTYRTAPTLSLTSSTPTIEHTPWNAIVVGSGSTIVGVHTGNGRGGVDFIVDGFTGLTNNNPVTLMNAVYFDAEL